jgi:hypothetical protein
MFMTMRRMAVLTVLAAGLTLGVRAAGVDTYQITGPVIEVTDAKIVIQKDDGKWEIARSADTKVAGDLKVGAKVTIKYTMTATAVTVKEK